MRIGTGYDVHRLGPERRLVIGGIEIPYELGLVGHSDADVLLHAIMDALLGAAALGDIGKLFPDTDERYRNISSLRLLKQVAKILEDEHYIIENIDATIIAQQPKMRPYIDRMRAVIADALGIEIFRVSVKATTEEGLGFTGSGEGISSQAICLLSHADDLRDNDVLVANGDGDGNIASRSCEGCSGCAMVADKDKDRTSSTEKKKKAGKKDKADKKSKKDKKGKKQL